MVKFNSKKKSKKVKSSIPEVSNVSVSLPPNMPVSNPGSNENISKSASSVPETSTSIEPKKTENGVPEATVQNQVNTKKNLEQEETIMGAIKENIKENKEDFKEYKEEAKDLASALKQEAGNLFNKFKKKVEKEKPKINENIPEISVKNEPNTISDIPDTLDNNLTTNQNTFNISQTNTETNLSENVKPDIQEATKPANKFSENTVVEEPNEENAIFTRTKEIKMPSNNLERPLINPSSPEAIYKNRKSSTDTNNSIKNETNSNSSLNNTQAIFKSTGIASRITTPVSGASTYNPSSPDVLFRKQNMEMQEAIKEEIKKQQNKSNYNTNDLIVKFVYKNYDIVATKRFNIFALIFGPLYFFYRKMYFYGLVIFLAETFAIYTLVLSSNFLLILFVYLLIGLICGAFFNSLYLKFVKSSVLEIEKSSDSQKEAEKTCKLRGGVSSTAPLIPIVVAALFFGLIMGMFNKKDGSVEREYAINIESNIEEYISNNEKYVIKMPTSDKNIACTRTSENDPWKLKEGYTITTGDCTTFMNSIANTTGSIYFKHLKSATIVVTPNGLVTNGTVLEIDSFTCTFLNPGQFNCQKSIK